ncbi:conserved membrane protein of unknown function [Microbacterium sp. Nx66]|uniref:hypothetical protein n=1 Tax=Microbacterium sp. Nx66 TaxID=2766784 RepID=UPI0016571036|nr:hypothetical protein [Microbacterium sp. Nx66]CAD5139153.1 conserved membrane protein of unknown function [Microbacterium sp. Nx66]
MGAGDEKGEGLLTPIVVGVALAMFSAAVAVASTFLIADPRIGVLAAMTLSFGCVGAAAGLLLTRRRTWGDPSWPPGTEPKPWTARRSRRVVLLYGVFLLLISVGGVVTLAGTDQNETDDPLRGWVLSTVFGVVGMTLIIRGVRRQPQPVHSSDRPESEPNVDVQEWMPLGPSRSRALFPWWALHVFSGQPLLLAMMIGAFLIPVAAGPLGAWTWPLGAVLLAVVAIIVSAVVRRRSRPPRISRDATRLLVGTKEIPTATITTAMVIAHPWEPDATARSIAVVLTASDDSRAVVGLRERGLLVLTDEQTEVLIAAIERTHIDLPRDKDDPRGRFSRMLYPNHLTKSDALHLVQEPPGDGEALPVGSSVT